jgi:hypothetical protein
MKLIESKTLGTAAASIEFTSIPNTFTDLVLLYSMQSVDSVAIMLLSFNGSSSNFTARHLQGNGSVAGSGTSPVQFAGAIQGVTSNTFGNSQLYIPNYTGSTNKSWSVDTVSEANQTTAYQEIVAGLWSNTAVISSLAISLTSGNIAAGSTASLYGILKGSDGIVTTS